MFHKLRSNLIPRGRYAIAWLLIAMLTIGAPLRADVFRTLRGSAADRLTALGGRTLHRSKATVNGAPATLTVYGFEGSPGERLATLARSLGLPPPQGRTDACLLSGSSGAERIHLLTLPAELDKTLALLITQRHLPSDSRQPPPWPDLPRPAGAEATFSATLAATRTTLVTAAVPYPPTAAATEADTLLRAAGWNLAAPSTPSFALYQRRSATCALLTQPGEIAGTTRLTLLQRLGQGP